MRMRLGEFILANQEAILVDWEAFAHSVWPRGVEITPIDLRDHARDILQATVRDMQTARTDQQRADKSHGLSDHGGADEARLLRASEEHGVGRVASGFNLRSVVAEYRALRASVLRQWRASNPAPDENDLEDLTRFNESIDQSLTKAVGSFTDLVEHSRKMFLAILGHDLRNPLSAVKMSADALKLIVKHDPQTVQIAGVIARSAAVMERMIHDLLEFTSVGLGRPLDMTAGPVDLRELCDDVIHEMQAAHPGCQVDCSASGPTTLTADAPRLRQAVSNLVRNAIEHGQPDRPIHITLIGDEQRVTIGVHNHGPAIPRDMLATIFNPLVRGSPEPRPHPRRPGSLGLGLYIVKAITAAHAGTVDVQSAADTGTTFTLSLPKHRATS